LYLSLSFSFSFSFPFSKVSIVHLERIKYDQDQAASLIQATARGMIQRMIRAREYDLIVLIQSISRGYTTRQRIERGHQARAKVAEKEMKDLIYTCAPECVFEATLIRMGMSFSKASTMHKKLMARNKGFTYALGENTLSNSQRFNKKSHVNNGPKYQHMRTFLVNEELTVLSLLKMLVRETTNSRFATMNLIDHHNWNRDGYMLYEDVYNCVQHILGGNVAGGVVSRKEMSNQIFPLLDPVCSGQIAVDDFIDLIYGKSSNSGATSSGAADNSKTSKNKTKKHKGKAALDNTVSRTKKDNHNNADSNARSALLAIKPYGGRSRPINSIITNANSNISKSAGHRAESCWKAQEVKVDSLELSKQYGSDRFDNEKERLLIKYVLNHYAAGLQYIFDQYCTVDKNNMKVKGVVMFDDRASHNQIKFTHAATLAHDFKIVCNRAKVDHFLKLKGIQDEELLDSLLRSNSKQSRATKKYNPLPKGTFSTFVWIDNDPTSIPRISKAGSLPVTPEEIKQVFNHRTRHVMQWRKLDTGNGLTSIASLALFLLDISMIACRRMNGGDELLNREMSSKEAEAAYFNAAGMECSWGLAILVICPILFLPLMFVCFFLPHIFFVCLFFTSKASLTQPSFDQSQYHLATIPRLAKRGTKPKKQKQAQTSTN
jgi:hypothetical protein